MHGCDKVIKCADLFLGQVADFPSRGASQDHDINVDSKETLEIDHSQVLLRLTSHNIMEVFEKLPFSLFHGLVCHLLPP